jgi:lysophospholipase L1-like esterase
MRLLSLGDSYTIGESVAAQDAWPMQLVRLLEQALKQQWKAQIIAKTGWSTDELSAAINFADAAHEIHPPYDLVSLAVGVNNQYRNRSVENYAVEFADLLQCAITFAAGDSPRSKAQRVLVLSIPDWGQTPFAANDARGAEKIAAQIDLFNAESRHQTLTAGANFIDVTPLSRAKDPELLAEDGLHPSAKAYTQWAHAALDRAFFALKMHK